MAPSTGLRGTVHARAAGGSPQCQLARSLTSLPPGPWRLLQPANATRDDGEWDMVRKLALAGFVEFAEPCIVECHDGKAECDACITSSGGSHEVHNLHAERANKPAVQELSAAELARMP